MNAPGVKPVNVLSPLSDVAKAIQTIYLLLLTASPIPSGPNAVLCLARLHEKSIRLSTGR